VAPALKAFTLMETLITLSVLSLVTIFLFNIYPTSLLAIRRGEQQLEANSRASSWLEIYQQDIPALFAMPLDTPVPLPGPLGAGGANYTTELVCSTLPAPSNDDKKLRKLTVTVSWELMKHQRTVTHTRYVANLTR